MPKEMRSCGNHGGGSERVHYCLPYDDLPELCAMVTFPKATVTSRPWRPPFFPYFCSKFLKEMGATADRNGSGEIQ